MPLSHHVSNGTRVHPHPSGSTTPGIPWIVGIAWWDCHSLFCLRLPGAPYRHTSRPTSNDGQPCKSSSPLELPDHLPSTVFAPPWQRSLPQVHRFHLHEPYPHHNLQVMFDYYSHKWIHDVWSSYLGLSHWYHRRKTVANSGYWWQTRYFLPETMLVKAASQQGAIQHGSPPLTLRLPRKTRMLHFWSVSLDHV